MSDTEELRALAGRLMVDFTQMKTFARDPLILVEGDGIRVRDDTGKWYIDGLSGVFVSSLGHGNQRVIQAATEQLRTLAFHAPTFSTNPTAIKLAGLLTSIAPAGFESLKFFSGGAEATEAAIKIARQFHFHSGNGKKFKVLSHYRGYHGGTGHALAASGSPSWRSVYEPFAPGFVHLHPPFTLAALCGLGGDALVDAAAALVEETIVLEGPETIAAFITEPIMLSAGVRVPPPGYLQRIRALCDKYNIVLVFDEIITGFGRTGALFAASLFGVTPDLLCFGKGVSGGYAPLSGVLVQEPIGRSFWGENEENVAFRAGHTFAGNPVACAVGLAAVQELIDRDLVGNALRMGSRLKAGLERIAARNDRVAEARGVGLLLGLAFSGDLGGPVYRAARRRGLLTREGSDFIAVAPPLVVSQAEVDEILRILGDAVDEAAASPVMSESALTT